MAITKAATVAGHFIKSYVDRIEKMEEERKAIGGDIRDIYAEAKGNGYDVKTLRWVVQERRMDSAARAERDALRDVYQHALDTAVGLVRGGMSLREAGRITGASKSSIHRALAVPAASHNSDGVITETGESCGGVESRHAEVGLSERDCASVLTKTGGPLTAGVAPGPHDTPALELGERRASSALDLAKNEVQPPATPSVGAVDDASALAAMEEAGQRLRQMRAERGL